MNVKERIKRRRYELLNAKFTNQKKNKNGLLSFLSSIFLLFSIALGVLIYGKNDENGKWLRDNFGIELSFSNVNKNMSSFIDNILSFDVFSFLNKESMLVSYESSYTYLGNDLFQKNDSSVTSIGKGVVIYADLNNGQNTIIIQHDLGYTATYVGVEDVFVKQYDRIEDKGIIGNSYNDIYIYFSINGEKKTYEEIVKLLQ